MKKDTSAGLGRLLDAEDSSRGAAQVEWLSRHRTRLQGIQIARPYAPESLKAEIEKPG